MWQIENAVTDVLALDIDSRFLCNGRPCTCPLIHKFGWDCRNIDLDAAREFGVPTVNLMRISTISVAEHFILLIPSLARKLRHAHAAALARAGCNDGSKSEGPPRTSR